MEGSRSLERGPGSSPQVPKAEEAGQAVPLRPKARGLRRLSTCVIGSRASAPGRSAASRGGGRHSGPPSRAEGSLPVAPEMGIEQANRAPWGRARRPSPPPVRSVYFASCYPSLSELLGCSTILGASALQMSAREARASGVAVCLGLMSSPKAPVWPLDILK